MVTVENYHLSNHRSKPVHFILEYDNGNNSIVIYWIDSRCEHQQWEGLAVYPLLRWWLHSFVLI